MGSCWQFIQSVEKRLAKMSQVRHDSSNFAVGFRQTKTDGLFNVILQKVKVPRKHTIYIYTYINIHIYMYMITQKIVHSKENQTFTLFNESHSYKTWFVWWSSKAQAGALRRRVPGARRQGDSLCFWGFFCVIVYIYIWLCYYVTWFYMFVLYRTYIYRCNSVFFF